MDVDGGVPPCLAHDDLIVTFIPFENGSGPDGKFLANFRGDGNLALGG